MSAIPQKGWAPHDVRAALEKAKAKDLAVTGGRTMAYVYDHGRPEIDAMAQEAYAMFKHANGLDFTAFPSSIALETDLVDMMAELLGGGSDTVGHFTSGGTESLILAVKAAREHARATRGVTEPELVLPTTAHPAFHKAAHYLGLKIIQTPVDPVTFKADPEALAAAITDRTALVVGSAVSYAHGVADPIVQIAAAAAKQGVWMHVDGCIGAFLLAYCRKLGEAVAPFDLSVPGVTSISTDVHKYGYAPKGGSILLFKDKTYRKYAYFANARTPGYAIINTTVQSSKSVGLLAAAWAVTKLIGEDGYLAFAHDIREATRALVAGIDAIAELAVLGRPETSLVAFASTDPHVSIFKVISELRKRGWYIHAQLARFGGPANAHLSVSPAHRAGVGQFLADLADAVAAARGYVAVENLAELEAELAKDGPTPGVIEKLYKAGGIIKSDAPRDPVQLDTIMNILPPDLIEALMIEFANTAFVVRR